MVATYARIAATLRSAMQQQQTEAATGSPVKNGSPFAAVHPSQPEPGTSLRLHRGATIRWHQRDPDRSLATKQRIIRMLFVVVVEFFVCWTPLYVLNTVSLFRPEAVYYGLGYRGICFLQLLAYASSCCNPITYCFMNRTFREEAEYLVEKITEHRCEPFVIQDLLVPSTSNNVTALVFGTRYAYEDARRNFLDDRLKKLSRFIGARRLSALFPGWLNRLAARVPVLKNNLAGPILDDLLAFAKREIQEHEESLDEHSNRDFIDAYLKKIRDNEPNASSNFHMNSLIGNIFSFFVAGSSTVQETLQWHLLVCADKPDLVQRRIQQEIDQVIGRERAPSWTDHTNMPFTVAVLWEVYRWRTVTPLGIPRVAGENITFKKHFIPKGTIVVANLRAVHMNPEYWKDPEEFNPLRFLKEDGSGLLPKPDQLIPFSVGIVTLNGDAWQDNRRFCLHVLRDLGFGRKSMEEHIKDEVQYLADKILELRGSPVDIRKYLIPSMSNNITSLVFGRRYPFEDHRRKFLDERLRKVVKIIGSGSLFTFLPSWAFLIFTTLPFTNVAKIKEVLEEMFEYVSEEVKQHESSLDESSNRDFIDGYIKKMKENKDNPRSSFKMGNLLGNVLNFFGAGSNTVQISIQWHLLNCADKVESVQRNIQNEIDSVVGHERQPCWEDHNNMHFTMATIWEMYRWRTVAPLSIPREAAEDVEYKDYFIPKGTVILPNLSAVHLDPVTWESPEIFDPHRFLKKDGSGLIAKPDQLIPFSIEYLVDKIAEHWGEPFVIQDLLVPSTFNNVTELVFGTRYAYEDARRNFLDDRLKNLSRFIAARRLSALFPGWLNRLAA
ncbi:hypothetical protein HPB49_024473 [Dermacentor silvarum]|uniref:Uncharacterized protein n=1 Tax=Dermacentor silvarum TaxID=543639 RepID=A0ACB8D114_DERSI|nr:hypothetical protein HPB49_024473 [Dermacentor silvarum]